jgi:hypothetical protein
MLPSTPTTATGSALPEAASRSVILSGAELDVAPLAMVMLACATTPSLTEFVFRPEMMHLCCPAFGLAHVTDFPPAEAAEPTVTLTPEMSPAEYVRVHINAADCAPFDV